MEQPVRTIPPSPVDQQFCPKCRKTLKQSTNFYKHANGEYDELCRKCLNMHIDAWDPDTYTWLMKRFDIPHIPTKWALIRDRAYAKDPVKFNAGAIFGKYVSAMKIKPYKGRTWADSQTLIEETEERGKSVAAIDEERLQALKESLDNGEITEAQYKTYTELEKNSSNYVSPGSKEELALQLGINVKEITEHLKEKYEGGGDGPSGAPLTRGNTNRGYGGNFMYPSNSGFEEVELEDVGAMLTKEDKLYLAMKWGRLYRADEWVALEKLYADFSSSFDIQGAAREDTLKMICKTSLKANQAIDAGDIESYQKLSRVYDSLMKSANFTEAQNKDDKNSGIRTVGQMVAFCERQKGAIPRYDLDKPQDVVDEVIKDLKNYTKSLIDEDKALAREIERYLKKKMIQEELNKRQNQQEEDISDKDITLFNKQQEMFRQRDAREEMDDD